MSMGTKAVVEAMLAVTNTMATMSQNQQWLSQLLKTVNEENRELSSAEMEQVRKMRDSALSQWNTMP